MIATRASVSDGDADLLTRVAARDAVAFRTLVDRHLKSLHAIGYRMTGDGGAAEEIAQEALLRLWRDAALLDPARGAGGWLYRVATNLALDRLRRQRFVIDIAPPEGADDAPLATEVIDAERERVAAIAAIAALPDPQRAAIVLTYYEELSNAAAAQALDMNIKAFESLLHRARAALRARLAPTREVIA